MTGKGGVTNEVPRCVCNDSRRRINYYGNTLFKEYTRSYVREQIIADNTRRRNLAFLWEENIAREMGDILLLRNKR